MRVNSLSIITISLLLSAVWGIWCVFWLPRGLEFAHTGLYCSEAWRLAQGDLPFVDATNSAAQLAPWWLSLVFRIYPAATLLDLRIIWAIAMLLCALVTAYLMLRYFNPVVSFIAAAASLFFVAGDTYETYLFTILSYNSMPYLPLLLTAWLWLSAYQHKGRLQLLLAAGAGVAAFLATTCRFPLVCIILLPILTMLYDRFCGVQTVGMRRAAITYLTTFLLGVSCFFLVLAATGLTDAFFIAWKMGTSGGTYGLDSLALRAANSTLNILLPSLAVVLIVTLFKYRKSLTVFLLKCGKTGEGIPGEPQKASGQMLSFLIAIILITGFIFLFGLVWFFIGDFPVSQYMISSAIQVLNDPILTRRVAWFIFILAISLILVDVMLNLFNRAGNARTARGAATAHDRCRLGIMAIFLALIMILGSNGPLDNAAYKGGVWLAIAMAACLCWHWTAAWSKHISRYYVAWLLKGVGIALLLACLGFGIFQEYHHSLWQLNTSPKTARLQGILTTPEHAAFIDSLVSAVERHSKPGDRILCYYGIAMTYYLTDRLPSTFRLNLTVFTNEARQAALKDMIKRDRIPKMIVYSDPPDPAYAIGNPFDDYVKEHYEAVEEIAEYERIPPDVIFERTYRIRIMLPKDRIINE